MSKRSHGLHLALAVLLTTTGCAGLLPAASTPSSPPIAPPLPGGLRYTVSVNGLSNESGWEGELEVGNAWDRALIDALSRSSRFIVVADDETRGAALDEQDLAASGRAAASASQVTATGHMTTAQLLVSGVILNIQQESKGGLGGINIKGFTLGGSREVVEVTMSLQVTDTSTGQTVASTQVTGEAAGSHMNLAVDDAEGSGSLTTFQSDNLGKAIQQAIEQAVAWFERELPSIPWRGSVARVDGADVFVNRGQREGIHAGQTFIAGEVDVVSDPVTGEVLHEIMNETARLRVKQAETKVSICEVVSGDPRSLHAGLAVRLP